MKPIDYGQQELGWVSISDIHNVFQEMLHEFDTTVWPPKTTGSRPYVQKFMESIKHKLYQRAKAHYSAFLSAGGRAPGAKQASEPAPDSRDAHAARLEQIGRRKS